ncbi:MAG: type VI secretion system contractile sheath large subunit [Gammaproteobacteria bacterium]|nr:type VI secretion system contractile sheath large subunit [Gammaproteobacteria bacterium]
MQNSATQVSHDQSAALPTSTATPSVDVDNQAEVFLSESSADINVDNQAEVFLSESSADINVDNQAEVLLPESSTDINVDNQAEVLLSESSADVNIDSQTEVLLSDCINSVEHDDFDQSVARWLNSSVSSCPKPTKERMLYVIQQAIINIDKHINSQITEILHQPRFQQLEASWRGLKYTVETEANYDEELTIKVKVFNAKWAEVGKDIGKAIEFDQSQIFHRIYSDEFDMPGGEPFGVILGDYQISHRPRPGAFVNDLDTLKEIALIATAALCPFITGVNSALFGLDSLREFGYPMDLQGIFSQKEYTKWRSLRDDEHTRFIGLTLPDMLMRQPYCADGTRPDTFVYQEKKDNPESDYLWGNSCYAFGSILIRAFANTSWFADIRGGIHEFGEGGVVRDLQYAQFDMDPNAIATKPATNIQMDDFLERELSELGFIPLCSYHSVENSTFYSNSSLHKPPHYNSDIANTNARLSGMIQYMLCVSRFGHYIKAIGRNKIGSFVSAQDCQRIFQNWLNQYTTSSDNSSSVLKARYPLSESKVEVIEQPGKPGYFTCVIYLKPHFQLDQLVSSIKLVTELAIGATKA